MGAISRYEKFGTIAQIFGQNSKNKKMVGAEGFEPPTYSV